MDFTYTPEQEKFRAEIAGWLEKNSAEAFGRKGEGLGGSTASLLDVRDDSRWTQLLDYHRRLYKAGYVALHWPKEWGGGGANMIEQAIYQDEVLRLGLPLYGANQLAIDRIGPTIMHLGTEQQKKRYLLKMLTGEEIWCQGYSEPRAGSDLAADARRARRRQLRSQWAKGVDQSRASRGLAGAAGAYRSCCAQAQGNLVSASRYA